jgi:hypothetical protein
MVAAMLVLVVVRTDLVAVLDLSLGIALAARRTALGVAEQRRQQAGPRGRGQQAHDSPPGANRGEGFVKESTQWASMG